MTHATGTPGLVETAASPCAFSATPQMPAGARRTHRSGWERRKRSRPGEIVAAAADMFGRFGYQRTRMIDIAQVAGVTKGTIYLYFHSKADLFAHCSASRVDYLLDSSSHSFGSSTNRSPTRP